MVKMMSGIKKVHCKKYTCDSAIEKSFMFLKHHITSENPKGQIFPTSLPEMHIKIIYHIIKFKVY